MGGGADTREWRGSVQDSRRERELGRRVAIRRLRSWCADASRFDVDRQDLAFEQGPLSGGRAPGAGAAVGAARDRTDRSGGRYRRLANQAPCVPTANRSRPRDGIEDNGLDVVESLHEPLRGASAAKPKRDIARGLLAEREC